MNKFFIIIGILLLTGCSGTMQKSLDIKENAGPPRVQPAPLADRMIAVPELDGKKITIAVYSFSDKTGQRKPADNIANLSSAVTQGAEVWVIKALSEVGNETWFEVVERVGMDNLIKERQLIRNTRQAYEKDLPNGPRELKPMVFAGLILEGGIIGYDSNTLTGGRGARYLGIGYSRQYRQDQVTVSLRAVSVLTGEVLLNVQAKKTIFSYGSSGDIFRFIEQGTQLIEFEDGTGKNESVTYSVRTAIEAAVLELVNQGHERGLWKIKGRE